MVVTPSVAFFLGQTNQLVSLGIFLALLALCLQRQALGLLLVIQARHGRSSLQNYDAILRFDALAEKTSLPVRISLIFLFALPLVISAAYKLFVGGVVTKEGGSNGGFFGTTGPPGTQRLGNGLSLMVNATLPFLVEPSINKTFGYNMYVISNSTTAMLDAPLPEYVSELRSSLGNTRSIEMSALVNATVCSRIGIDPKQRHNDSWGEDADTIDLYTGSFFGFLSEPGNNSVVYTSTFTRERTFASQAIGSFVSRRQCRGTWQISLSSATLVDATCGDEPYGNQTMITNNYLALRQYTSLLTEFITQPYNYSL